MKNKKNPHAVALGRLGGLKGGPSRALSMSAEQRTEIARYAAQVRWAKVKGLEHVEDFNQEDGDRIEWKGRRTDDGAGKGVARRSK